MRSKPFSSTPGTQLALTLFLGALGQFFLARREEPWTLGAGFVFYFPALFLWVRSILSSSPKVPAVISPRMEAGLFLGILLLAAFFRTYRLDQFPAGIFIDESFEGWGALRILKEGWRPFSNFTGFLVHNISIYYLLALWFKFTKATQFSLFLASVCLSLAALPLLYWAFRQLSNPFTALAGLFLIAIMRWHVTYSRDMHPAIEILIYMGGALSLWLYANRTQKTWAYLTGGVVLGAGFYSYQAYQAFPLAMLLFAVYEWFQRPAQAHRLRNFSLFFLSAAAVGAPFLWNLHGNSDLNRHEGELMAFPGLFQKGLGAVASHFLETCLSFNRTGDSWYIHNIPYHRLLDDGTGALLVLGFVLALFRFRERQSFYAVTGLAVMCLPAFLSVAATHASRLFGALPFIALLAAGAFTFIFKIVFESLSRSRIWLGGGCLAILLGFSAFQNFYDYFVVQARDPDCWRAEDGAEVSWIGKEMANDGGGYSYLICPRFYGHYTLLFLGFDRRERMFRLRLPESLDLENLPKDKGICVVLDEGHSGVLRLFQSLYPGGETKTFRDPQGNPIAHLYRLESSKFHPRKLDAYGLSGNYIRSLDWNARPALAHQDPLLNFTFRNDFPILDFPPLSIEWKGQLVVPQKGFYRFLSVTTDTAKMTLDGKTLFTEGGRESTDLYLRRGPHRIGVFFQKASGQDAAFSLLWRTPGNEKFEVIPFSVYRPAR